MGGVPAFHHRGVRCRRPGTSRFEHRAAAQLVEHLLAHRQADGVPAGVPQLVQELADGAALSWEQRGERLREILGIDRPNTLRAVAPAPRPADLSPTLEWNQQRNSGAEEKQAQDQQQAQATRPTAADEPGPLNRAVHTWHEGPTISAVRHVAGHEGQLVNDRYLLTALIGQGGMARVWRGHDQRLKRPVTVKEILFEPAATLSERASLTARMEIEAQAAARMRYQNIVAVHDAFHFQGASWIVME